MTKDKRADIRIPLLSEKVTVKTIGYLRELAMTDICSGGVFVKIVDRDDFLPPETPLVIQLALPGDLGGLELHGEVRRINWSVNKKRKIDNVGMAIMFWAIPDNTKKIFDAYRVYLRNKQIITVSKRIIEEFFGPNGAPKPIA